MHLKWVLGVLPLFLLASTAACRDETAVAQQSPVDIARYASSGAPKLEFRYKGTADHITNTGDFIKVKYEDGGGILVDGREYRLIGAHTHNPSEHTLDGERFPLEVHLVHTSNSGEFAVVGIVYRRGEANAPIQAITDSAPAQGEKDTALSSSLAADEFLPAGGGYYAYLGSLTTPPYTEGVQWLVLSEPIEVSEEQVSRLAELTGGGTNNRALQPLNGRRITAYRAR